MTMKVLSGNSRSNHVIDVDVIVIIKLDEVNGGFGLNLLDDGAHPLRAVLVLTLHLLPDQRVTHLTRLAGLRRIICWRKEFHNESSDI